MSSASVPAEIRRIRAEDWPLTKALRLEALADTPIGFLETLAQAEQLDDPAWQARAARGAEGGDSFQVLALEQDRPVGTCVCFLQDGRAWLAAVYVTPARRGEGLLARLVEQASEWARGQGVSQLVLEVHEANPRARRAYQRLGFVDTGRRRPYPLEPGGRELELTRPL